MAEVDGAANLSVNFNQTLDLRFGDKDIARLLLRIQCSNVRFTRRVFQFSLRDNRCLDRVRFNYEMFGFTPRDNVEFVCMYGYDTNLAQDVERFRFLRSLPGAYVFVQPYRPLPDGRPANLERFFDKRADALIDELIRIIFPMAFSYSGWGPLDNSRQQPPLPQRCRAGLCS
jgi:hypothetical protein